MIEIYTVHRPGRGPDDDRVRLLINMQREGEIAFQLHYGRDVTDYRRSAYYSVLQQCCDGNMHRGACYESRKL